MKTIFKTCFILWAALLLAGCAKKETVDTKLQAPYSLRVSSDNVLTWSIVKGAVAYLPNINGVDYETVTSNQLALSDVVEGGHLVIKVKAIGDGVLQQDSDWSNELVYDMAVPLATPLLVVSGKTVTWEPIEGALKYEYDINGSVVMTEGNMIDLSGYLAERYVIKVRALPSDTALNSASAWSEEVTIAIFDRLATPVLVVLQPSLKNPAEAMVRWESVEGASGYEVYVNDVKQECDGTSLDFSGKLGTFNVKVTAVNPGLYDSSETAETTITINDYGKGTEEEPYKIYSASDWNDFSDLVSNDEGKAGYQDKFIELADDIDFENTCVIPAGKSALLSFKGTLDGKNHTLKNAKIGDGTASHQAFFYLLNGTVKNLKFDNITVTGGNATGAASSAAVLTAGNSNVEFIIENCHVSNSTIVSGPQEGENGGSYAAGLVGRCNNADAIIRNCSVTNSTINSAWANAGGVVGYVGKGLLDGILSSNNTVTAENSGLVGGVLAGMGGGTLINIVSKDNVCSVKTVSCGGVIGACTSDDAKIINVFSDGNTVKSNKHANLLFLGLIMGTDGNARTTLLANSLVLTGTAEYVFTPSTSGDKSYNFAGGIGIALGYGSATVESGYYFQNYRTRFDLAYSVDAVAAGYSSKGYRFAIGVKQNIGTQESKGGTDGAFVVSKEAQLKDKDGTVMNALNAWVEANKVTYPSLKTWTKDESGYPKL